MADPAPVLGGELAFVAAGQAVDAGLDVPHPCWSVFKAQSAPRERSALCLKTDLLALGAVLRGVVLRIILGCRRRWAGNPRIAVVIEHRVTAARPVHLGRGRTVGPALAVRSDTRPACGAVIVGCWYTNRFTPLLTRRQMVNMVGSRSHPSCEGQPSNDHGCDELTHIDTFHFSPNCYRCRCSRRVGQFGEYPPRPGDGGRSPLLFARGDRPPWPTDCARRWMSLFIPIGAHRHTYTTDSSHGRSRRPLRADALLQGAAAGFREAPRPLRRAQRRYRHRPADPAGWG